MQFHFGQARLVMHKVVCVASTLFWKKFTITQNPFSNGSELL